MSSQGVMSREQANNNPGLCPIKGRRIAIIITWFESSWTKDTDRRYNYGDRQVCGLR